MKILKSKEFLLFSALVLIHLGLAVYFFGLPLIWKIIYNTLICLLVLADVIFCLLVGEALWKKIECHRWKIR